MGFPCTGFSPVRCRVRAVADAEGWQLTLCSQGPLRVLCWQSCSSQLSERFIFASSILCRLTWARSYLHALFLPREGRAKGQKPSPAKGQKRKLPEEKEPGAEERGNMDHSSPRVMPKECPGHSRESKQQHSCSLPGWPGWGPCGVPCVALAL